MDVLLNHLLVVKGLLLVLDEFTKLVIGDGPVILLLSIKNILLDFVRIVLILRAPWTRMIKPLRIVILRLLLIVELVLLLLQLLTDDAG